MTMDRAKFLAQLRANKTKLVPLVIDGWKEPVYLRPQTVGDIKAEILAAPGEAADARGRLIKDPLYLARSIAKIVRDEKGELLFDPDDNAQVQTLMDALAETGPAISRQVHEAYNRINAPVEAEVTPTGN
jgi:hypothetical protein